MKELNASIIREELLKLGISPQLRAFEWLTRAIQLCSEDKKLRENPAGQLYDILAQEYNYGSLAILQAIRRAVKTAWDNQLSHEEFNKVFEYYQKENKSISALEFIVRIADYLSREEN